MINFVDRYGRRRVGKTALVIRSYFSILKTIAAGNHKLGKIAANLEVPVTEENSSKSKQGRYFIKDNFI